MANFEEYSRKYKHVKMRRRDGILEMTLHTNGGSLRWALEPEIELGNAFADIGSDRENRIVILTGTGNEFIGPRHSGDMSIYTAHDRNITPLVMDTVHGYAKRIITRFLEIEVPMIGVVNGPATRHAEVGLMCDIVIASDDVTFEDTAHFTHGGSGVPGDGISTVYTMLLGLNRARYLALTGQVLSAKEAKELGLVAELMPREKLLPRAWELAEQLAKKPDLVLRYTRIVLTHPLKKMMDDSIMYHLTLESMAGLEKAAVLRQQGKK
ncbi:MAG: enoyl-CoA hydratase/isomerase family protein [Betaproteobacteria bacterium]|nr:enoyl-CoA hydratase/isomerase family protein [Betaproteobacteria bacterium]